MPFETLYNQLLSTADEDFYLIETDFFTALASIPTEKRPVCVTAFLAISNWCGTSLRSGVWTFYEVCNVEEIESVHQYLKENGAEEMATVLALGIHDYQNPKYAENLDYPEEWIEEADKIDLWINDNHKCIVEWEFKLLMDNRELICSL